MKITQTITALHQWPSYVVAFAILAMAAACDRTPRSEEAPLKTAETENAKKQVNDYKANPTSTQKAEADRALAALDREIAELEQRVADKPDAEASQKLDSLKATRANLATSYSKGEYESVTSKVGDAFKAMGKSISDAAKATADTVHDAVTSDKKD